MVKSQRKKLELRAETILSHSLLELGNKLSCSAKFRGVGRAGSWVPTTAAPRPGLRVYRGNTRKPEKVEYFQPPMRLPRSSLR